MKQAVDSGIKNLLALLLSLATQVAKLVQPFIAHRTPMASADSTAHTHAAISQPAQRIADMDPGDRMAALRFATRHRKQQDFAALLEACSETLREQPHEARRLLMSACVHGFSAGMHAFFRLLYTAAAEAEAAVGSSPYAEGSWHHLLTQLHLCVSGCLHNGRMHALADVCRFMCEVHEACPPVRVGRIPIAGPMVCAVRQGGEVARRLLQCLGDGSFDEIEAMLGTMQQPLAGGPLWRKARHAFTWEHSRQMLRAAARAGDIASVACILHYLQQGYPRFTQVNPRVYRPVYDPAVEFRLCVTTQPPGKEWATATEANMALYWAWVAQAGAAVVQGHTPLPPLAAFTPDTWSFSDEVRGVAQALQEGSREEVASVVGLLPLAGMTFHNLERMACACARQSGNSVPGLPLMGRLLQGWVDAFKHTCTTVQCCDDARCVHKVRCLGGGLGTHMSGILKRALETGPPGFVEMLLDIRPQVQITPVSDHVVQRGLYSSNIQQHKQAAAQRAIANANCVLLQHSLCSPHCSSLSVDSRLPALIKHTKAMQDNLRNMAKIDASYPGHAQPSAPATFRALRDLVRAHLRLSCKQAGVAPTSALVVEGGEGLWGDVMWERRAGLLLHRLSLRQHGTACHE